jgi:pimeloyl-ACP methyl ester carboxylesterase
MHSWPERRFRISHAVERGLFLRRLAAEEPRGTAVYVHGLGESALCFERLMADERLGGWSHLAVDLAGYGKSFWARAPLALEEHADRLAELLDALVGEPAVVLGHSMGGVVATLLAERAKRLVRALVNVEGNISASDCHFSSRAAEHTEESWLARGYDQLLDGLYREERENPAVLRPYCASIQMCDPRAFFRNSRELVEASAAETLAARMAAIDRPKIYLFGAPRGAGDLSRGLLSRAGVEMVGIPDAGHWPFLDHPRAFVAELLAFLDRLPAQP